MALNVVEHPSPIQTSNGAGMDGEVDFSSGKGDGNRSSDCAGLRFYFLEHLRGIFTLTLPSQLSFTVC